MPASDAIRRRSYTITLTRASAGSYVNGVWQAGGDSTVTVKGITQPLTGKERMNMPEGIRDSGRFRLWALDEIKTSDTLTINNTPCVILTSEWWDDHWRAIAGDNDGIT